MVQKLNELEKPELSIIISCRNEVVGTIITICSALEEFKTGIKGEIIVCDNSDKKAYMRSLRGRIRDSEWLEDDKVKFLTQDYPCIFTAREKAISKASGKYILVLDSHCILGRNSLSQMLRTIKKTKNPGFIYGLMNFSRDHETDAFCDRDVEDFLGIRIFKYNYKNSTEFEIPFRGMPFLCEKTFFETINGYGTLSKHKLSWGGGDFLLGLKSAMLGYTNIINTKALVIHLGPFKNDKYFPVSYIRESGRKYPKRFGMLIAAYIIGGEELLKIRISQLESRLGFDYLTGEDIQKAKDLGNAEYLELLFSSEYSYKDIVRKFKSMQIKSSKVSIGRIGLPKRGKLIIPDKVPSDKVNKVSKGKYNKNSWQARMGK